MWTSVTIYAAIYVVGACAFFVVSPFFFKKWNWSVHNWDDNPPPQLVSLGWPLVITVYILWWTLWLVGLILSIPGNLLDKYHLWFANYISDDAIKKRKEKKEASCRVHTPLIDIAAEEWAKEDLAYREANCKDCGQSLRKA